MGTKEKLNKVNSDINEKFDVNIKLFKAGGSWVITPEKGQNVDHKKMKEIKEYILLHSEELEEDDDI